MTEDPYSVTYRYNQGILCLYMSIQYGTMKCRVDAKGGHFNAVQYIIKQQN